MTQLYSLVYSLALPLVLLRLAWRSRRVPAYRERWGERFGFYGRCSLRADLWIHAVSMGEVQAARSIVEHFLARYPDAGVMLTTTTPTGSERVCELFQDRLRHVYMPFDLPPILDRFLDAVRPRLALVMETEIWPNMLRACEHRGIPVVLANARLSARSARGYARLSGFTRRTLRRFALICAHGTADADRFRALGASPERVHAIGNIKFDVHRPADLIARARSPGQPWGSERPVWIAASTHEGEEEQVLDAHREIRGRLPRSLLVLVPRHPERFERVAALVARRGFTVARRSAGDPCDDGVSVYLGDTMGELPALVAAADAAFIGGSLVPIGGHNLLEAAAAGVAVAVGPHVFNFAQITEMLLSAGAAVQVSDAQDLARCIGDWLSDPVTRRCIGEQGLEVVEANRGALGRLLRLLEGLFEEAAGQ